MNRHLCEIALLSSFVAPLACGDDDGTQTTEAATTTDTSGPAPTSTGPDPDTGSTTTADPTTTDASTTTAEPTTSGTSEGETTVAETTEGETTGGDAGVISNAPEVCESPDYIFPLLPGEAGHWAATTLTPSAYPFEVQRVVYDLTGGAAGGQGNNSFAHDVAVFVSDVPEPDGSPSTSAAIYQLYSQPEDAAAAEARTVDIELSSPIVLEDGQSIIVAVQMAAEGDQSLCLAACFDTGGIPETDWWSNAAAEPFPWADLTKFGFGSSFTTRAIGAPQ